MASLGVWGQGWAGPGSPGAASLVPSPVLH